MAVTETVRIVTEGVDKATKDIKRTADATDELTESTEEYNDASSGAFGALNGMLGGAVTKFQGAIKGIRGMVTGMKTLRGALISTGIGALVVAVGSLIAYFTRTERGAQTLRVVMATVGGVIDKLMDSVIGLGEGLMDLFTNPIETVKEFGNTIKSFVTDKIEQLVEGLGLLGRAISLLFEGEFSAAASTAAEGFAKVGDSALALNPATAVMYQVAQAVSEVAVEANQAARAAAALERRMNALKVQEREHLIVRAQTNKAIAETRLAVEDESASFEDRIEALERAITLEQQTIDQELAMARERANILDAQSKLSESSEETLREVAEARARVVDLETQSLKTQKRLEGERQALLKQSEAATNAANAAAAKAAQDELERQYAAQDQLDLLLGTEEDREIAALVAKYEKMFALADEFGYGEQELRERQRKELKAINDKYDKQEADAQEKSDRKALAVRKKTADMALGITNSFLNFLGSTMAKADEDDVDRQRKQFRKQKQLQAAGVLINTAAAIVAALSPPPVGGGPIGGVPIAIKTGLEGAAQLAAISNEKFPGGGGDESIGRGIELPSELTEGATDTPTVPALGGFIATTPPPVQAFVVSQNVTTQQQLDAELAARTTL